MNYCKILIAYTLLTQPETLEQCQDLAAMQAELMPSLHMLALQWEILDPREAKHMLCQPQDFVADLKLLQGRYRELHGAPTLTEAQRFPNRELVNDLLSYNRAYRQDLQTRLALDQVHSEQVRAALQETEQLYRVWDLVRDARCEYYYLTVRRQALKQLREIIGEAAFYSGELPPHIPVWRLPKQQ